jgi:hypothetical protein
MQDDRGSFIKSQNNLNTELDALGATARGESRMTKRMPIDDELELHAGLSSAKPGAGRSGSSLAFNHGDDKSHDGLSHGLTTGYPMLSPVHPRSPMPGSEFESPLRTESPLPRVHTPINWKTGVGY